MVQNTQIPVVIFDFLKKVFTYERGALAILSAPPAFGFTELAKLIFRGVDHRDLILPVFLSFCCLVLYGLVFIGDFLTGLRASAVEAKREGRTDFVESSKLWRSFWKLFGVFALLLIMTVFTIMFTVFESRWPFLTFLIAIPTVMLMVILYEYHSIGENHKRTYGYKPEYYTFFDRLANTIEDGIMVKISNWFGGSGSKTKPAPNKEELINKKYEEYENHKEL